MGGATNDPTSKLVAKVLAKSPKPRVAQPKGPPQKKAPLLSKSRQQAFNAFIPVRTSTAPARVFSPKPKPPINSFVPKSWSPPMSHLMASNVCCQQHFHLYCSQGRSHRSRSYAVLHDCMIGWPKSEVFNSMKFSFPELPTDELQSLMQQKQAAWMVVSSKMSSVALFSDYTNWWSRLAPLLEDLASLNV